jgi:NhaP-type Na+/H+ or K+/H+ antiporter
MELPPGEEVVMEMVAGLLIGFICGYVVRALISRHRRAETLRRRRERGY